MRRLPFAVALSAGLLGAPPARAAQSLAPADRLIAAAISDSAAWTRLARLTDQFGPRLSGSRNLEDAIDWILAEMKRDGLDNVRGEPVMVPHWVRGEESAHLVRPRAKPLAMLGLGNSVGTPAAGIEAPLLVVGSFDELQARAADARGRIVLFDAPFAGYGPTVRYRTAGPSVAARLGAVAVLVRSVTPQSLGTPHTGTLVYDSTAPRIPAAAITVEDAMMLHRMQDRGERPVVRLRMGARMLPDARSRNVVAEIRGRERPDEVVVLGGHLDSWDVGQGAMDDGGGCVAAWEALRLMRALGLRPRRTVRVVLWTNEENGGRGAAAYLARHRSEVDRHVLAIESDNGVFTPRGFAFTGSDSARGVIARVAALLRPIGADSVTTGGGGADIGPLMQLGVPGMSPIVDGTKYFWYHHSEADTMDKLDPREVGLVTAALAVMAFVVADLPDPPSALGAGVATIWIDGEWFDRDTAKVSVFDHGLLYGDGVFEGIRVYGGRIFRLREHLERLYDSARAIWLTIPMPMDEMTALAEEAVRRSGLQDAYIRPIITRGPGDLGLDPRKCARPSVIIIVDAIRLWPAEAYQRGLRVVTAGTPMPHREALSPRVKSLNYLPHILAKIEGIHAGADEVLMLDSSGTVAEGSGQNIFVVKGGGIRTPPAHAGILKGVTRDAVIELALEAGYPMAEELLNRYDVYTADEAFFTGTAAEIVFIREVDGRVLGQHAGPVTNDLAARFRRLTRG